MRGRAHRILLAALFGVWVLVAWPKLSEQFASLEQWRERIGDRAIEERAALIDYPAWNVAQQLRQATPDDASILVLAYTGPEHVNYYKTRFDYYLYPRRVRIEANSGAAAGDSRFLAVFRDSQPNLRQEAFAGVWNEGELRQRLASLEKILAVQHLELYRVRP